jgi:hypothetical protein
MPAGRPAKYKTAEQMQELIDKYFKSCEGTVLRDDEDEIVYDKFGRPVIIDQKPPTICGLALALGFSSRQTLLNYQDKDEFMDTITRAKLKIEEYAEQRLYDKDGVNGAKFNLINNFKGWRDKQEQEVTATNTNINYDMTKLSKEQLEAIMSMTDPAEIEKYYNECINGK